MRRFLVSTVILAAFLATAATVAAPPETPLSEYAARRAALLKTVGAPIVVIGYETRDVGALRDFYQQNDFFYLTGHTEPGAALLLIPQTKKTKKAGLPAEILFVPPGNRRSIVYDGLSIFPEAPDVNEKTGFADVRPREELNATLGRALKHFSELYTLLPADPRAEVNSLHAARVRDALEEAFPDAGLKDGRSAIAAMRAVKSKNEVAWLQTATDVTNEAHRAAMRAARPGMKEYELAAVMEYEFRRKNCTPGYTSIVGSGPNANILHYPAGEREMQDGEVVLLDVGAECGGYVTDITRTIPVGGKFTDRQRQIYEIVLGAQQAAIDATRPGMRMGGDGEDSLSRIANEYIQKKGEEIGEDLTKYIRHGLSHPVGLSVHDVGARGRPLEPGMVFTIEPGLYLPEENFGVRIEDVVLVTENGYVLMSADIPRSVEAVEAMMTDSR